jgi:hypothetical protein
MPSEIPIESGLTNFDYQVELDSTIYNMSIYWNDREEHWYMDIYNEDQLALLLGAKLVQSYDMLKDYNDVRLPPGLLLYFKAATDAAETADSLGTDYTLVYFTEEEVETLGLADAF